MPVLNIKTYNKKIQLLQRLLDGIKLHKTDEDFPSMLKEEVIRKEMDEYVGLRASYEEAASKAHQLNSLFQTADKKLDKDAAKWKTIVYGGYGKKSQVVRDYGLVPFKDNRPKARNADSK
jgi:hypothetical protein